MRLAGQAGVGGGRRPASVFDIPLTDQPGHDQQPKSLQEQFLVRQALQTLYDVFLFLDIDELADEVFW